MNRRSSIAAMAALSVAGSSSFAGPVNFWDAEIDREDDAALTKFPFLSDIRRATEMLDPVMSRLNTAAVSRFEMIFDVFGPCWKLAISLDAAKLHVSWAKADLVGLANETENRPARRDFYIKGVILTAPFKKEIIDPVNKIFAWTPASFNEKAPAGQDVPVLYIRRHQKGAGKGLLLRAQKLSMQVPNLPELLKTKKELLDAIGAVA
jgi:hypothetical protein